MADKKIDLTHFDEAVKKYDLSSFDQPAASNDSEAPGMLKSAGLGALQGASLGFADEAEAGLRSILPDSAGGGDYNKLIKDIRQRYKDAEETNPKSFLAGNLGGGLATAVIPGLGAAKGAQLANMVKAGVIGGALNSLGTRDDDKLSVQAAKDALEGAAVGGGGAAVLGSAVPALAKAVGNKVSSSRLGEDVSEVFNKIRSGKVKTFGKGAQDAFAQDAREAAKTDILGNLEGPIKNASDDAYATIRAAQENVPNNLGINEVGSKVEQIKAAAPGLSQNVGEGDLASLNTNLNALIGGKGKTEVSNSELAGYIKNIGGLLDESSVKEKPALYKYILNSKAELTDLLNTNTPESIQNAKKLTDQMFRITQAEAPELHLGVNLDSIKGVQNSGTRGTAERKLTGMIENYQDKGGQEKIDLDSFLNKLKSQGADTMGLSSTASAPGEATIDSIRNNLKDVSRNVYLANETNKLSPMQQSGGTLLTSLGHGIKSKTLQGTELVGKGTSVIDNIVKADPMYISTLANKVADTKLAGILNNLATQPDAKRKAVMFSIMQQPVYRDMINTAQSSEGTP